jgi:biopolymer transport protein ExbD
MKFREREEPDARPDVTNMVDIALNLIIYFAVTASFAIAGSFMVKLPQANATQVVDKSQRVSVEIQLSGQMAVDGRPVNLSELKAVLVETARKNPKTLVVISADRAVSHGQVVSVMDLAEEAGLARLAIATERKASGPETEAPP